MKLHPRNLYQGSYDIIQLVEKHPNLLKHTIINDKGDHTINFSDPLAVRALNKSLVSMYYRVRDWDFPLENLTPAIPGREEYIHLVADLLARYHDGKIPIGPKLRAIDIGTGASVIYPIIGQFHYQWAFKAVDIDMDVLTYGQKILDSNPTLKDVIQLKHQKNYKHFFKEIIGGHEFYDLTICNPPFFKSEEDAMKQNLRKEKRLSGQNESKKRELVGTNKELIYPGGELTFLKSMIKESKEFASNVYWFTSLVSKKENLTEIYVLLRKLKATKVETIPMIHGNRNSRIVAWTFISKPKRKELMSRKFI